MLAKHMKTGNYCLIIPDYMSAAKISVSVISRNLWCTQVKITRLFNGSRTTNNLCAALDLTLTFMYELIYWFTGNHISFETRKRHRLTEMTELPVFNFLKRHYSPTKSWSGHWSVTLSAATVVQKTGGEFTAALLTSAGTTRKISSKTCFILVTLKWNSRFLLSHNSQNSSIILGWIAKIETNFLRCLCSFSGSDLYVTMWKQHVMDTWCSREPPWSSGRTIGSLQGGQEGGSEVTALRWAFGSRVTRAHLYQNTGRQSTSGCRKNSWSLSAAGETSFTSSENIKTIHEFQLKWLWRTSERCLHVSKVCYSSSSNHQLLWSTHLIFMKLLLIIKMFPFCNFSIDDLFPSCSHRAKY